MTKNHKFMLSMATIAILSGTGALADTAHSSQAVQTQQDANALNSGAKAKQNAQNAQASSANKAQTPAGQSSTLLAQVATLQADGTQAAQAGAAAGGVQNADAGQQAKVSEVELKVDSKKLKYNDTEVELTDGTADLTGKSDKIKIESDLKDITGLKDLKISTSEDITIGKSSGQTSAVTIGGEEPTATVAGKNGYAFDLNAKTISVNGAQGKTTDLNVNENSSISTTGGTTLGANSYINIASGKTLTVSGELKASEGSVNLNGGTLTTNGKATFGSNKLSVKDGGTLNFGGETSIAGAFSTTKSKAVALNLGSGANLTLEGAATLKNKDAASLDKIEFAGSSSTLTLKGKLTADATNFITTNGATITFAEQSSKQTSANGSKITNDVTFGYGTTLNLGKNVHLTLGEKGKDVKLQGANIVFNDSTSTLNVSNLSANASGFDMSKGGTLELSNDSKSKISGNLSLGEGANIKIISAATSATAGTLSVDTLNLVKTGKVDLGGGVLDISSGLYAESATQNIDISKGGTIDFGEYSYSNIKGELKTTANQNTAFNVKKGASVEFENLNLADEKSKLTLDGGVLNLGTLTTAKKDSLNLKSGSLNFLGNKDKTNESTLMVDSGLDLGKVSTSIQSGAKVKVISASGQTSNGGDLTLKELRLYGGEISLGKLTAANISADDTYNASDTATLIFNGSKGYAQATLKGSLEASTDSSFTLGDNAFGDKDATTAETIKVGDGATLSFDSGSFDINGKLTQEKGKVIINSANLDFNQAFSISSGGNLEVAKDAYAVLNLNAAKTNGAATDTAHEIKTGDLDLTKASSALINIADKAELKFADNSAVQKLKLGENSTIKVNTGGKVSFAKEKGVISGKESSLWLGEYSALYVDGDFELSAAGNLTAYNISQGLADTKGGSTIGFVVQNGKEMNLNGTLKSKADASATKLVFSNGAVAEFKGTLQSASSNSKLIFNETGIKSTLEGGTAGDSLSFIKGTTSIVGDIDATNLALNLKGGSLSADANLNKLKALELDEGSLSVKGNFETSEGAKISFVQKNPQGISDSIKVDGTATLDKTTFGIVLAPKVSSTATNYTLLSADEVKFASGKSLTDITAEVQARKNLQELIDKYGFAAPTGADTTTLVSAAVKKGVVTLSEDGKVLSATIQPTYDTSSLKALKESDLEADKKLLEAMNKTSGQGGIVKKAKDLDTAVTSLTTRIENVQKQSEAQIAQEFTGGDNIDSEILLSAFSGKTNQNTRDAIGVDVLTGTKGIIKDIKESASSTSNFATSTASVVNTINLANDMAISGRVAQANNPYGNLAEGFVGEYASVQGDLPLYYANNAYTNGVWANAIGGLNRIDGENGTLFGASVGFDKQFDGILTGIYFSYTKAGLNDKLVEQKTENMQVGLYASFNQKDIEINVKAYGQASITDMSNKRGDSIAESNFVRRYAGINANVGKIFSLNNNKTFIKPFVGEAYYFTHTPTYHEKGISALETHKSMNNNALSIDVGVDLRHYLGENSFIYAIPSIEHYVMNEGDSFTAGFVGSETTFTIEHKGKRKTYAQVLLGGNINVTERFNVNLGFGTKKVLAGQMTDSKGDKKDELYLSGNLGLKYKF